MAGISVRFYQHFTRRAIQGILVSAMVLSAVAKLDAESVMLTTYYPAPSGVYTNMITTQDTFLARDGGNVGIGTSSPSGKLHVNGNMITTRDTFLARDSGNVGIGTSSPSGKLHVNGNMITTRDAILARDSGSVGIGTPSPSEKLHVNGSIYASGSFFKSGNLGSANFGLSVWGGEGGVVAGFNNGRTIAMGQTTSGYTGFGITSGNVPLGSYYYDPFSNRMVLQAYAPIQKIDIAAGLVDVLGGLRPGPSATVTNCSWGSNQGEGTLRYNYSTHALEYCNGATWASAGAGAGSPWFSPVFSFAYNAPPVDATINLGSWGQFKICALNAVQHDGVNGGFCFVGLWGSQWTLHYGKWQQGGIVCQAVCY